MCRATSYCCCCCVNTCAWLVLSPTPPAPLLKPSECPRAIALAPESGWFLPDPTRLDTSRHMPNAAMRLPLTPSTQKVIRARFPAYCLASPREGRGELLDALVFAWPFHPRDQRCSMADQVDLQVAPVLVSPTPSLIPPLRTHIPSLPTPLAGRVGAMRCRRRWTEAAVGCPGSMPCAWAPFTAPGAGRGAMGAAVRRWVLWASQRARCRASGCPAPLVRAISGCMGARFGQHPRLPPPACPAEQADGEPLHMINVT